MREPVQWRWGISFFGRPHEYHALCENSRRIVRADGSGKCHHKCRRHRAFFNVMKELDRVSLVALLNEVQNLGASQFALSWMLTSNVARSVQ